MMKVILLVLLLGVCAVGQTSADLRRKYGKPKLETYQIRPQIDMTVTYGDAGKVCRMLIEPSATWMGVMKFEEEGNFLKWAVITEIFDELIPKNQRGKLLNGPRHGRVAWEYEKARLSLNNDTEKSVRALIVVKEGCK